MEGDHVVVHNSERSRLFFGTLCPISAIEPASSSELATAVLSTRKYEYHKV